MSRQAVNILIFLLSILILVGLANVYFMLQKDNHVLHPIETTEEEIESDLQTGEPSDVSPEESTGIAEEDRGNQQPSTTAREKSDRQENAEPPSDGQHRTASVAKDPDIDVAYWVDRSIPLTFESRGGAADTIQRQYRHIVRDLEQVQQHLKEGKHEQAMALIRPMLWDRSNIYREDAEWYQILAFISAGDTNTATNQLNRLLRDNIHLYYFLGRELHAELVPIRKLMQQQVQRERERSGNGY